MADHVFYSYLYYIYMLLKYKPDQKVSGVLCYSVLIADLSIILLQKGNKEKHGLSAVG